MNSEEYRVLHLITRLDRGGSAINTLSTCAGLCAKGFKVTLGSGLSLESAMAEEEKKALDRAVREARGDGVRFITLPRLVRRLHPVYDGIALCRLLFMMRRYKFDIVHTHTSKAGILGRWAAWIAGVPIIIHTPHGHVFSGYFGRLKTRFFIEMERLSALITGAIITLTGKCMEDHLAYGIATREKFRIIHSGVCLSRFLNADPDAARRIREARGIPVDALIVGSVGRLVPVKGYDRFLNAAALIRQKEPRAFFIIIGEGPLREELERQAGELGISGSLLMPGWKERVEDWLRCMDIFLLTSRNEGMGRVLVEAMACGMPVVATDVGGVSSVVEHGATGLLVRPGDEEAMVRSVLRLLKDPDLRRALGEKGRRRSEDFSTGAMVDKIEALYRERIRRCS